MNKENTNAVSFGAPPARVTRARAKALGTSSAVPPPSKPLQDQKRVLRVKSKREALDENSRSTVVADSFQHKRRAVLKDVTNSACEDSNVNIISTTKVQVNPHIQFLVVANFAKFEL